ncbi:MAG: RNA 2',3'-cyclic phosphodiesterase [Bacillota bacterium]|nr:RNA 2',3'-cyclic phosphodiesterase [Bacillota bacterium]
MRLFIALSFTDEVKEKLYRRALLLKNSSSQGTFSRRENLHLTLAFLGEVERKQLGKIKAVMESIEAPALNISFSTLGRFPGRDGDIAWLGMDAAPELTAYAESLCEKLREQGFAIDKRPFKAHLTLGRRVKPSIIPKKLKQDDVITTDKIRISLMESQRINGVLTYTELFHI